jgi:peptidoglycan/xylan/chitin deacetylase (PgdA/CDA1 family)
MGLPKTLRTVAALLVLASLCACRAIRPTPPDNPATNPKVKFLVTFDDGPSARTWYNPTQAILEQLAANDVQTNICAIFFIQTQHPRGAAKPRGMEVLREIPRRGHIVGLHSVSPRGHLNHVKMPTNELVALLEDGRQLVKRVSGEAPVFVRPPFGASNPVTRAIYRDLDLRMLLADVPARDGVIYGFNGSPRRRGNMRRRLTSIRNKLVEQPPGLEPYPVIISFHDVNPYTARHMTEYLHILVEEATRAGLAFPAQPFYDNPREAASAALSRAIPPTPTCGSGRRCGRSIGRHRSAR